MATKYNRKKTTPGQVVRHWRVFIGAVDQPKKKKRSNFTPRPDDVLCHVCGEMQHIVSWNVAKTNIVFEEGVDRSPVPRIGSHRGGGSRANKNGYSCPGSYQVPQI